MTVKRFHSGAAEAETIEKRDAKATSDRTALREENMVRSAPCPESQAKVVKTRAPSDAGTVRVSSADRSSQLDSHRATGVTWRTREITNQIRSRVLHHSVHLRLYLALMAV